MLLIYNLVVQSYFAIIHLAALFSGKARRWVLGRITWRQQLAEQYKPGGPTVWMHCASLGEFEQGRPLLEAIRTQYPHIKIVVSFFSPSGYEVRKNYTGADYVCYLPADGKRNAADFIQALKPTLAIFVKYELWWHYLDALRLAKVPVVLVSANVRQPPLPLLGFYKRLYGMLNYVFVQHADNEAVLHQSLGYQNVLTTGDSRFDRVTQIAAEARPLPEIEQFVNGRFCFVAGSTWPPDEKLLMEGVKLWEANIEHPYVLIIVPHETDADSVEAIAAQWGKLAIRYTELGKAQPHHHVLIVDKLGLLSRIYRYAQLVWVGGGFSYGIHNTLEAAVYGKPVLFGPKYAKFREAVDLIEAGAARSITQPAVLAAAIAEAFEQSAAYRHSCAAAAAYVRQNVGATGRILQKLQALGYLLTVA